MDMQDRTSAYCTCIQKKTQIQTYYYEERERETYGLRFRQIVLLCLSLQDRLQREAEKECGPTGSVSDHRLEENHVWPKRERGSEWELKTLCQTLFSFLLNKNTNRLDTYLTQKKILLSSTHFPRTLSHTEKLNIFWGMQQTADVAEYFTANRKEILRVRQCDRLDILYT